MSADLPAEGVVGQRFFGRWTPLLAALCPVSVLGWIAMVGAGAVTAWLELHGRERLLPFSALWAHLAVAGLGAMTVLTAAALVVAGEDRQVRRLGLADRSAHLPLPRRLLHWRLIDTEERLVIVDRPGPLYQLVPVAFGWTLLALPIGLVLLAARVFGARAVEYPLAVGLWVATSVGLGVCMALRPSERLAVDRARRSVALWWRQGWRSHRTEVRFSDVRSLTVVRQKDRRRVLRFDLLDGRSVQLLVVVPELAGVLALVRDRVLSRMGRPPADPGPEPALRGPAGRPV